MVRRSPGSARVAPGRSQTPGQLRRGRRYRLACAVPGITAIIAYLLCDLHPRFVTFNDDLLTRSCPRGQSKICFRQPLRGGT